LAICLYLWHFHFSQKHFKKSVYNLLNKKNGINQVEDGCKKSQ